MPNFGEYLEQRFGGRTVQLGPLFFDKTAPREKRFTFGDLNPAIPFPMLTRYFGINQEGKGRLTGGEAINVEALNNAVKQGAFPGWDTLFADNDLEALNDIAYVDSGKTDRFGAPLNVWEAVVVPADNAWRAAHPEGGPAPGPSIPDLRPLLKKVRAELASRQKSLETVHLPEGGGKPAIAVRDAANAVIKAEIKALQGIVLEIDEGSK